MARTTGSKDMARDVRIRVIAFLEVQLKPNSTLVYGAFAAASKHCGFHFNTIKNTWQHRDVLTSKRSNCSPSRSLSADELKAMIEAVPARQRTTVRSAATAVGVPFATLQRYIEPGQPLRAVNASFKPALTPELRLERVRFALAFVESQTGSCGVLCVHAVVVGLFLKPAQMRMLMSSGQCTMLFTLMRNSSLSTASQVASSCPSLSGCRTCRAQASATSRRSCFWQLWRALSTTTTRRHDLTGSWASFRSSRSERRNAQQRNRRVASSSSRLAT